MKFDIVRAWKDEIYRQSLNDEQLSTLPANPVGELELSDSDLAAVSGGGGLLGITIISKVNLFSISVLSNAFNSTCFLNENF